MCWDAEGARDWSDVPLVADKETKQDVLNAIAALIGRPRRQVANGSTEPKEAFLDVIEHLRLAIRPDQRKPALGRAIAEAAGLDWQPEHDSTLTRSGGGDTVTLAGLQRVREAAQVILRAPPTPGQVNGIQGRDYIQAAPSSTSTPAIFEIDPERYDRSSNAHTELQNRLASLLRQHGVNPLSWSPGAGDPPFDIAWRVGEVLYICEVKSATQENQRTQGRLGLGQLLEYGARAAAAGETRVVLVFAMERAILPIQRMAGELANIQFLAGPTLADDLAKLLRA